MPTDIWVAVASDDSGRYGMGAILCAPKKDTRISRPLRVTQKSENVALYKAIEAAIVFAGHMAAKQVTIHLDVPTVVTAMRDGKPIRGCARYTTRIHQQTRHYDMTVTVQYSWGPQMMLAHELANLALLDRRADAKEWAANRNYTLIL